MSNFTPAPLKPYFWKIDFRHVDLVVGLVPMFCWMGAGYRLFAHWGERYNLTMAALLFWLGATLIRRGFARSYALAMRARFAPLPGVAGEDYLMFEAETPETAHKLKWAAEDAGFLSVEDGAFRVTTLQYDVQVPFEMLRYEPILKDGKMHALLISFEAPEGPGSMRFAATPKYLGKNLQIAGHRDARCAWALRVIEGMKTAALRTEVCAPPPPLPVGIAR